MAVDGIRAGNIVLDALVRDASEITFSDIETLYQLQTNAAGKVQGANLLERARHEERKLLEINPSYGASCLVLASSMEVLPYQSWIERYLPAGLRAPSHQVSARVRSAR